MAATVQPREHSNSEASSVTSTMASPLGCPLHNLPAELLHAILILLPVRTLYKARGLNKYFKNFVDENETTLLLDTLAYNRARLTKRGELLSTTNFLEGLKKFYAYYGLPEDPQDFFRIYTSLTLRCIQKGAHSYSDETDEEDEEQQMVADDDALQAGWFKGAVGDMVFGPQGGGISYETSIKEALASEASVVGKLRAVLLVRMKFNPETNSELLRTLSSFQSIPSSRYTEIYGCPVHFLTSRIWGYGGRFSLFEGVCEGLPDLLNIPSFEEVAEEDGYRPHPFLACCAKSKAAWCIAADASNQGLTSLPIFKQAALLEEMFVW